MSFPLCMVGAGWLPAAARGDWVRGGSQACGPGVGGVLAGAGNRGLLCFTACVVGAGWLTGGGCWVLVRCFFASILLASVLAGRRLVGGGNQRVGVRGAATPTGTVGVWVCG